MTDKAAGNGAGEEPAPPVTLRLSGRLFRDLDEIRWRRRTSRSALIREALEEYVERHGDAATAEPVA